MHLRWPCNSQRESGRFERIDPRESIRRKKTKPIFIMCERAIRANRLKSAICNFSPPKRDSQREGVQFGNPHTIRKNRAIRANLRIHSRESGHLMDAPNPGWQDKRHLTQTDCNSLGLGDRSLASAGAERNWAVPMRLPIRSPALDKICAPIGSQNFIQHWGQDLLGHFQSSGAAKMAICPRNA